MVIIMSLHFLHIKNTYILGSLGGVLLFWRNWFFVFKQYCFGKIMTLFFYFIFLFKQYCFKNFCGILQKYRNSLKLRNWILEAAWLFFGVFFKTWFLLLLSKTLYLVSSKLEKIMFFSWKSTRKNRLLKCWSFWGGLLFFSIWSL